MIRTATHLEVQTIKLVTNTQILPSSGCIARAVALGPLRGNPELTIEGYFGTIIVGGGLDPTRNSGAIDFVANRLGGEPVQSPRGGGGLRVAVITPLIGGPQLVVKDNLSACAICKISLPWLDTITRY